MLSTCRVKLGKNEAPHVPTFHVVSGYLRILKSYAQLKNRQSIRMGTQFT